MALTIALGVAASAAWFSAFVHGVWSLAHLSGKSSLPRMVLQGMRWFDEENFSARGRVLQRRFVRSFAAFFGILVLLIAVAALTSSR